jgi:drug/metabolite transporter (DMT)-like permease
MRTSTTGLGLAAFSAATFATSGTFATALIGSGWSPGSAVTVRVGIAAVALTPPALMQMRGRWQLLRRSWATVLAFGLVAVAGCQLFYFNALHHLSVGVALLLEYSGTLMVVAWLWLRHAQRPKRLTIIGGAVAIFGMVLVLDLTGSQHVDLAGVLWGLAAAVGMATYFMISSRTDDQLPPMITAWTGMVVGTVALAFCSLTGILTWHASTADTRLAGHETSWLVPVLGVSLVAAALAYVSGIGAARLLGARLASFVGLAEVLFAVLWAWVALGQSPDVMQAIGGVLVLGGIVLVRVDEKAPETQVAESVEIPVPTP